MTMRPHSVLEPVDGRRPHRGARRDFAALLASRASVPPRRLVAPGPTGAELDRMVAAAAAAPSHGGLRNFRLVAIQPASRPALAELFVAAEREADPGASPQALQRAREKAMHAPSLVLLIVRAFADHPDIPLIEQHASAGAALGALLFAAHGMGFGAMAVSGEKMGSNALRQAFAIADFEHPLCFLAIGTPNGEARAKQRPAVSDILTQW